MRPLASILTESAGVFLGLPPALQQELLGVVNPALRIAGAPEDVIQSCWELLDRLELGQGCVEGGYLEKIRPYAPKIAEVVDCYGFGLSPDAALGLIAEPSSPPSGHSVFKYKPGSFDVNCPPPSSTIPDTLTRVGMEVPEEREANSSIKPYIPIIFGMAGVQLSDVYLRDEESIVQKLRTLPHSPKITILGPGNSKTEIQYAFRLLDLARRSGIVQVYEYFDSEGFCEILYKDSPLLNKAPHQVEFYSGRNGDFFKTPISEADVVILIHSDQMAERLVERLAEITRPGGHVLWQHDYDWNIMIKGAKKFMAPLSADELRLRAERHFEIKNHHSGMVLETWGAHAWFYYKRFPVEYFCLQKLL